MEVESTITLSAADATAHIVENPLVHDLLQDFHPTAVSIGSTLAPWAVVASLPFAPEIVLPSIQYFDETFPEMTSQYGFKCSFNPTFSTNSKSEWISKGYYGLDQGPIVLMIENHRSEFLWRLMRRCPFIIEGLRRAGFSGGWLDND